MALTKEALLRAIPAVAVFSAASVAGGLVKFPSPVGSIALDSLPGYFAAAYFTPLVGALVGAIGHIGSAATAGFPIGPALHAIVALQMAVWCGGFGAIIRHINRPWAIYVAAVIAVAANSLLSPLLLTLVGLPTATAKALVPFLAVASTANVALAALALRFLSAARIRGI